MSTTGPSEPKTASKESRGNSPSKVSSSQSSVKGSPTKHFSNINDKLKVSLNENQTDCVVDGHKESSQLPAEWHSLSFCEKEDCFDGGGDGPASVEWDDEGSPLLGSSTPLVARWASSLENLLNDTEGSDRFKLYLENCGPKHYIMMIEFWYACNGLRRLPRIEDLPGTIEAIWGKYIKRDTIEVSEKTKKIIKEEIDKENFGRAIFNKAQQEVETIMKNTIYVNFLKSEYCTADIFGKENVEYNTELHDNEMLVASHLPTVHEDLEYQTLHYKPSVRPKYSPRLGLTSDNILASAKYRTDKTRLEDNAGIFLRRTDRFEQDHFHAGYVSGHAASLQDSEIQSLSSGGRTDRSSSYKSGSLGDGQQMSHRHLRHQIHLAKQYAQLNKEDDPTVTSITSSHLPRTMKNEIRSGPSPSTNPTEFFQLVSEKLEKLKQETKNDEKLKQSLCKISHSEENANEVRRQHAENSLPPSLLWSKLQEKRILEDNDPNLSDQSILDNHINSWDPTTASPGSPKQTAPVRETRMRQMPHLNLPQSSFYNPTVSYHSKNINKGRHHASSSAPQSAVGTPLDGRQGLMQPRNNNHGRRRERGHDVYSNFSSDSGNVADYHDGSERFLSANFPKSRSMPDYIENQPANSDGGCSSRRRQGSGTRRSIRRPQADLTDSGVSDSGRSAAPSSSVKRVTNWLNNSCSEVPEKDHHRSRATRSTSHSIAALSSSSLAQKSHYSSSNSNSTAALTSSTNITHLGQEMMSLELSRDSPLGQSQSHLVHERRKNRGNGSSSSSKSTGDGGSNGSTLRKHKSSSAPSPAPPLTVIMYHFPDDSVPYVVKLHSPVITLKMFKEHLPKKGNFRYFFKTIDIDVDCLVHLEVTDDEAEIPLYEGKVVSHMRDH